MLRQKTWPGFASVVNNSDMSHEQIIRAWGISEDILLTWYSSGAPIYAHLALRARSDLGYVSGHYFGWSINDKWLIAPNGRKISLQRLENIAKVQAKHAIRLVK